VQVQKEGSSIPNVTFPVKQILRHHWPPNMRTPIPNKRASNTVAVLSTSPLPVPRASIQRYFKSLTSLLNMVSRKPHVLNNGAAPIAQSSNSDGTVENSQNSHASESERIKQFILNLTIDMRDLERYYHISFSQKRIQRLGEYFTEQDGGLFTIFDFDNLDQNGKVDFLLARAYVTRQLQSLRAEWSRVQNLEPLLGWTSGLIDLCEKRQAVDHVDWKEAAQTLANTRKAIDVLQMEIRNDELTGKTSRFLAYRAAQAIQELQGHMAEWQQFYCTYDPSFDWWIKSEWELLPSKMSELVATIRTQLIGIGSDEEDAIVGQPSGREGILDDLKSEVIPYTPEEIIKVGETEYEWCEREMIKASRELGYGSDWRKALEHVKKMYVEPGQQIYMVRELREEAIDYVTKHDMITVPQVVRETIRTYMMSPAAQKTNPFFLGGDSIQVSYPTSTMSHDFKKMIMRGNNKPFSRSTVFHELIPGHNLQFYYMDRYKTYRRPFMTPFWTEGWAFYWEMILWDRGFPYTPEYRIGMLFWRMHRCLRIIFSLKFHLGQMTPQECIDLLVEKGGHERATAEGEVRRSFNGDYNPLYQAGYMLGALQFYALRKEILDAELMTEKEFHDRVLPENNMPVEMVRALLKNEKLERYHQPSWRFYGDVEGSAISTRTNSA
jgi:hypothetical protein